MSFENIEREIDKSDETYEWTPFLGKASRLMLDVVQAAEPIQSVIKAHPEIQKLSDMPIHWTHIYAINRALTALREHCEPEHDYITMVDGGEGA